MTTATPTPTTIRPTPPIVGVWASSRPFRASLGLQREDDPETWGAELLGLAGVWPEFCLVAARCASLGRHLATSCDVAGMLHA